MSLLLIPVIERIHKLAPTKLWTSLMPIVHVLETLSRCEEVFECFSFVGEKDEDNMRVKCNTTYCLYATKNIRKSVCKLSTEALQH